jgi:hypothetical protein
MNSTYRLALGMLLVFAIAVGVLLYVMPSPHKATDYLVIGAVGTMLCLLLMFVVLIKAARKRPGGKSDS